MNELFNTKVLAMHLRDGLEGSFSEYCLCADLRVLLNVPESRRDAMRIQKKSCLKLPDNVLCLPDDVLSCSNLHLSYSN